MLPLPLTRACVTAPSATLQQLPPREEHRIQPRPTRAGASAVALPQAKTLMLVHPQLRLPMCTCVQQRCKQLPSVQTAVIRKCL